MRDSFQFINSFLKILITGTKKIKELITALIIKLYTMFSKSQGVGGKII
jgi:hypothetical protein